MGLLDNLLTKALDEEKATQKGGKGVKAIKKVNSKTIAKELATKIAEIERREGALEEKENQLDKRQQDLDKKLTEVEEIRKKEIAKLEKIAELNREEAKNLLLEATEKRLAESMAPKDKEEEEEEEETVEEKAKELLVEAMQHGATDYVAEYTVSSVQLPSEELKGRVIGREGRNIGAFEQATGVGMKYGQP